MRKFISHPGDFSPSYYVINFDWLIKLYTAKLPLFVYAFFRFFSFALKNTRVSAIRFWAPTISRSKV
ncbi:hypothetical protein RclHR1_20320004 [Rhizophagus clarus]|uniref:Uncharacterized protein n=1 Tax=Rhizophagus clarus TaxID=94130 RepID=A0A2Z6R3N1_9GLOM|nr:hypothetical protein RclHR1_20320004 [Rhizophagus clarus]